MTHPAFHHDSVAARRAVLLASLVLAVVWTALAGGCGSRGPENLLPPRIHYGEHECDECKMIISEERFAAGMIVQRVDGRRREAAFDDINCMFLHERSLADGERVLALFVHDAITGQWLATDDAVYLHSRALPTPMASGVAASTSREALEPLQKEHGGLFVTLAWLRERFAQHGNTWPAGNENGAEHP